MKPDRSDRRFKCTACGSNSFGRRTMCAACIETGNYRHDFAAFKALGGGAYAASAANKAIKAGALPAPASCLCVDCGKQASLYEHRDYNKPLDVAPTCKSCNSRRGPAIPLYGGIKKIVDFGFTPYTSMKRTAQLFALLGLDTSLLDELPKKRLDHAAWVSLLPAFDQPQKEIQPTTIQQMCRAMPDVFRVNWPSSPPTQSLDQWAALA